MASNQVTVVIGFRWWVMPYLKTLTFFCILTGLEPDTEKVASLIADHGFKLGFK